MADPTFPVYVFRSDGFSRSGNTVVAVAPIALVTTVYGGGGVGGEASLSAAFGGAVVFKNDETGACFVGVWGARNASRFRADLRTKTQIEVLNKMPDARLSRWGASKARPKRTGLGGLIEQ